MNRDDTPRVWFRRAAQRRQRVLVSWPFGLEQARHRASAFGPTEKFTNSPYTLNTLNPKLAFKKLWPKGFNSVANL